MNQVPQGLPRDWRRTVRYLKRDPLHGGPPASAPGWGPEDSPLNALGLPLPNFEGLYRDGIPCHINYDTAYEYWLNKQENPQAFNGLPVYLELSEYRMIYLTSMMPMQLFASCQPLTVQPLPDGSNIYSAEAGSIEADFQDAFTWYKRWLEFLHYESHGRPQFHRLSMLAKTVKQWNLAQSLFPPAEECAENGLFPVPPPMQEWMWPWYFWTVWQIRRDLMPVPDESQSLHFSIWTLNRCKENESAVERALFAGDWLEDRESHIPDGLRSLADPDLGQSVMEDLHSVVLNQRDVFQTHALRYWSFKRPWKKMWLIMDEDNGPQDIDQKVMECQRFLNADVHGSQLLETHPILLRQVREKTDSCVINGTERCSGDWAQGDTVVETWCGHITCFHCLQSYWAQHHMDLDYGVVPNPATVGDWPCVLCRTSPGRLRSKLEIAQTNIVGADGDAAAEHNIIDLTHEPIPHYR